MSRPCSSSSSSSSSAGKKSHQRGSKSTSSKRSPADFLAEVLGRPVVVRLNNGTDYKGTLACLDDRMNIAMEHTEEHIGSYLTNRYGDTFIRGNNVLYISAAAPTAHASSSAGPSSTSTDDVRL
eukprot:GHVQ01034432.1.p1 GENE.GHVQ01034432.1~~GHVQ01034432.1.p1  ORF type:complete len:124 (-),score=26.16 GHVQ01034432.1:126-497(-)